MMAPNRKRWILVTLTLTILTLKRLDNFIDQIKHKRLIVVYLEIELKPKKIIS